MRQFRDRLLSTTVICSASLFAVTGTANAQSTGQDAQSTPAVTQAAPIGPRTQAESTTAASGEGTETIVVTGSRIPQSPNLTSASPVTVVNSAEVKFEGAIRAEDLINQLPQAFAAQASSISNGSTGTATINLRNLGDVRTLVLINGRRLIPGDVTTSAADINFIPTSLIKSVDVLTGGASSTYGADAVAGVVNFKLDTEFEGLRIDSQYSIFQHNNGSNLLGIRDAQTARNISYPDGNTVGGGAFQGTLVFGAGSKDGRGHVTAYVGYQQQDPIVQSERDFSNCNAGITGYGTTACGGSSTSAAGRFSLPTVFGAINPATGKPTIVQAASTYSVNQNATGQFQSGSQLFNFAPYNYFQRPDERYTAGAFAHYDISDAFKPYLEVMFMDDRTTADIAPSGIFSGQVTTLNCNNPLISAQETALLCKPTNLVGFRAPGVNGPTDPGAAGTVFNTDASGPFTRANLSILSRRNVEGGPRQDDLRHTDYRIVVGTKGEIAKGVTYDIYAQFANVIFNENYTGEFSIARENRATDVVANPAVGGVAGIAAGTPICRSVLNGTDPNCVPYNIFTPGGVTQAALNYVQVPGFQEGNTKETVVDGSISFQGDEYGIKSPFADAGIGLNFGGEYRRESLELRTDTEFSTGDLAGQGAATLPVSGAYSVGEGFVEALIPLIQNKPFFQEFTVGLGYRYSKYSVQGQSDTYKATGTWSPITGIVLRAGYNRAVRAPNIQELFAPNKVALDGATDLCAGAAPKMSLAQCSKETNFNPALYGFITPNPANQYNGFIGGNQNLKPEKADTVDLGVVLAPKFLPRFNVSVDAFDIRVNGTIGGLGPDNIQNQCAQGFDQYCSLVHRDAQDSIWISPAGFVVDTTQNVGRLATRGIDVQAGYTQPTARFGTFGFSFVGTYTDKLTFQAPGVARYDCAGFYGTTCGTPTPAFRSKTRVTWQIPHGPDLSFQWRYISAVRDDNNVYTIGGPPALGGGPTGDSGNRLPSFNYFDLAATFRVTDKASFRLGVNNITDSDPPIVGSQYLTPVFGNGNTFPAVYDYAGRYIFAGFSLDF